MANTEVELIPPSLRESMPDSILKLPEYAARECTNGISNVTTGRSFSPSDNESQHKINGLPTMEQPSNPHVEDRKNSIAFARDLDHHLPANLDSSEADSLAKIGLGQTGKEDDSATVPVATRRGVPMPMTINMDENGASEGGETGTNNEADSSLRDDLVTYEALVYDLERESSISSFTSIAGARYLTK